MATAVKQDSAHQQPNGNLAPEPDVEESGGSRRWILLTLVAVLVAIGLTWGYRQWSYGRAHESTDDAAIDGHLVPVLAKVSGYVQIVHVSDNDHVREDSLLVQIDPEEYRVKLSQAEADLAAARASAGTRSTGGQAQAAVSQATGQRASLDAQIQAARANETKAKQDLARMEDLAAKQVISKMQLDAPRRRPQRPTLSRCNRRRPQRGARSKAPKRASVSPTRGSRRHKQRVTTRRFSFRTLACTRRSRGLCRESRSSRASSSKPVSRCSRSSPTLGSS
jgi:multidrug resistance efflux pump